MIGNESYTSIICDISYRYNALNRLLKGPEIVIKVHKFGIINQ